MLKKLGALALFTALALGAASCAFNPHDMKIEPSDMLKAAPGEAPELSSLQNERSTVMVMPVKYDQGVRRENGGGLNNAIVNAIKGAGTLDARVGGSQMDQVIQELKLSNSALFSQEGGAKIGKLMKARYICWLTVNSMEGSTVDSSYYRTVEVNKVKRKQRVTQFTTTGSASVSFSMVDVQSGLMVISETGADTERETNSRRPGRDLESRLAANAASNAIRDFKASIGAKFPAMGYIKELRGGGAAALVVLPGVTSLSIGTRVKVFVLRKQSDPLTKKVETRFSPIGNMHVGLVDNTGIWCKVGSGQKVIRLGHGVQTAGNSR